MSKPKEMNKYGSLYCLRKEVKYIVILAQDRIRKGLANICL
jgi:hypothetical protein